MDTYRQVLPPNYLCVDAERPLIDCECPVTDVVPKLPDLPSFDDSGRHFLWMIAVGAAVIVIILLFIGIYKSRDQLRRIFSQCYRSEGPKEKKDEKSSA